jgi:bacteriorhodopsin
MESLTLGQFDLVYNSFSLSIACMGACALFLLAARQHVRQEYRPALLVSAVVVAVACYHYVRIFSSWGHAYALQDGAYLATGVPFNDAYRYADWLLTVPLLMVELIAVLNLTKSKSGSLFARLSIAAVLMIVTGYPGEISPDMTTKLIWGTVSTVPFLYIMYVLWVELSKAMGDQPPRVGVLMRNLRFLILGTWGVYPIAYLAPVLGLSGAGSMVGLQVGYTIADITAKAGMGLMIFAIAMEKTRAAGGVEAPAAPMVPAAA